MTPDFSETARFSEQQFFLEPSRLLAHWVVLTQDSFRIDIDVPLKVGLGERVQE